MAITGPIPLPETGMDAFLNALKEGAETKKTMAQANLPFGGANVPGPAGQIVGLEMVKRLYGENSPQYQQAKSAFDLNQRGVQARVDYQNILSGTAPKRFSTNLGKTAQELEDIKQGFLPGTRIPLNEEQKEYYKGKYGLAMLKPTTDADTRKRNLYARNMEITINKINPESLTQYSGIKGVANLANEIRKDQQGKASPEYKAYQTSMTNAKLLAKQVRQFYGDSITPEVQAGLRELTNPTTWLKSPEIAMQNYNSFVDTLRSEAKTYQQAGQSPDVYSGEQGAQISSPQAANQPQTPSAGKIRPEDITVENLQHTAKELGISVPEVIERLKAKGYDIPEGPINAG